MKGLFKYALLASFGISSAAHTEEFRQYDAHVHGHVTFNIAQDGNELLFAISAPGADVVGFEHAPDNEAQHEKIEEAEQQLKNANDIIFLTASAGCHVEHVDVGNTLENDIHEEHQAQGNHGHDNHGHVNHGQEMQQDEESGHGEFAVEYHFECKNITNLKQIDTAWFKYFPATEEVAVNLLTDSVQVAAELNKNSTSIKF